MKSGHGHQKFPVPEPSSEVRLGGRGPVLRSALAPVGRWHVNPTLTLPQPWLALACRELGCVCSDTCQLSKQLQGRCDTGVTSFPLVQRHHCLTWGCTATLPQPEAMAPLGTLWRDCQVTARPFICPTETLSLWAGTGSDEMFTSPSPSCPHFPSCFPCWKVLTVMPWKLCDGQINKNYCGVIVGINPVLSL